jgi:hypothetical protein
VFCIEKILYSAHWVCWILAHGDSLGSLYETDFQSGLFYSVYGINDILFAVFLPMPSYGHQRNLKSRPLPDRVALIWATIFEIVHLNTLDHG